MRNLMRLLLLTALLLNQLRTLGQGEPFMDISLPQILPASPEAAGFVKAGYGNANLSNGAVSAGIPLYTLAVKNVSWPISIAYSSQGVKVDESSSRVGYGWNLNAFGVITRTVKGKPDELATPYRIPPNLGSAEAATFNFVKNLTNSNLSYDAEPDIYHFNFGGYSGKFVFDTSGNAFVTSHTNLKIEVTGSSRETFIITTTDGVRYKFGASDFEKVRSNSFGMASDYMNNLKSAYFLYRIEIPGGEWINFTYSSLNTQAATGISESFTVNTGAVDDICHVCPVNSQVAMPIVTTNEGTNKVEYTTRRISSITTSNDQTVNFSYEDRPDQSDDKRITTVTVSSTGKTIKRFSLGYYDPPGFDGLDDAPGGVITIIGRFFLTRLTEQMFPELDGPAVDTTPQHYIFNYKDLDLTPKPISKKQDHFGFYNNNTGSLLPYFQGFPLYSQSSYLNGNREPNAEYATRGILQSITYPTGGKEEFFYEGNTIFDYLTVPVTPILKELYGSFTGGGTHYTYQSSNFTVPYKQKVTLTMASTYNGGGTAPLGRIVEYFLVGSMDTVYQNYLMGDQSYTVEKELEPDTYYMKLKIRTNSDNYGYFGVTYDTSLTATSYPANVLTGGVRLRKIKYTTPESNSTYSKFYHYKALGGDYSSGIGTVRNFYYSESKQGIACPYESGFLGVLSICRYSTMSSNTAYNIFNMNGSHIFYRNVIESNDSLFANGGTEYSFIDPDPASTSLVYWGSGLPDEPTDNYGTLSGQLYRTRVFDSSKTILSDQYTRWDTIYPSGKTVLAVLARNNYAVLDAAPYDDEMEAFDVMRYHYRDTWYRKRSVVTKTFEGGLSSYDSTVYNYSTPANMLPQEVISSDSRGDVVKTVQKYPTDYTGNAVLTSMQDKNMIGETVEVLSYKNNVLQQQKKISYKNWLSVNEVIKPDTIKVKASSADVLHDAMYFEKYDSSGNILQARKPDDNPMSFFWDHKKTFPVAEISNASYDQSAYTSFEGDSWGNWTVSSGSINNTGGVTGFRSFTGTLTKTSLPSATYAVTLWTKSSATVNSAAGTLIRTVRGWKLYKWVLTNPGTVTVTGSLLDELRLTPKDAMINTTTYIPFVGSSSKAGTNNEIAYYEYDQLSRLQRIRDIDSNIIKEYTYKYLDSISHCTNTTPQWTPTGPTACIKNSNNNNTGVQTREERDMNNCSSTYLQYRTYSMGVTDACPVVPSCTGANKRVVAGVCQTGIKVYTDNISYGPTNWECFYHYEFSDGYWTETFTEWNTTACMEITE